MNRYFYIQPALEPLLAQYQANWLAQPGKPYTVITGHYARTPVVSEGITTFTAILDQESYPIPNTYYYLPDEFEALEEGQAPTMYEAELQGFILEVNPATVPESIYTLLSTTPGITGYPDAHALQTALTDA